MTQKHGPWTIQGTSQKYENSFINVREDQVLQPDGQPGRYATVKMKQGVAVLPIDSDRIVYITRQFRGECGYETDRDVAAALVVRQRGLAAVGHRVKMLGEGLSVGSLLTQESHGYAKS